MDKCVITCLFGFLILWDLGGNNENDKREKNRSYGNRCHDAYNHRIPDKSGPYVGGYTERCHRSSGIYDGVVNPHSCVGY